MLDTLVERVVARDRELRREAAGEIERIGRIYHDFATEVGRAGGGDRLLGSVTKHGADFDARTIAREPITELGLARVGEPIITMLPRLTTPAAKRRPTSPVPSTPTRLGVSRASTMLPPLAFQYS